MKKSLLLLILGLSLYSCGCSSSSSNNEEVYVCTGSSSKCYHATDDCRGLRNCRGSIKAMSLEEAEDWGRRPCKICY